MNKGTLRLYVGTWVGAFLVIVFKLSWTFLISYPIAVIIVEWLCNLSQKAKQIKQRARQ